MEVSRTENKTPTRIARRCLKICNRRCQQWKCRSIYRRAQCCRRQTSGLFRIKGNEPNAERWRVGLQRIVVGSRCRTNKTRIGKERLLVFALVLPLLKGQPRNGGLLTSIGGEVWRFEKWLCWQI